MNVINSVPCISNTKLSGRIEYTDNGHIVGWAYDENESHRALHIEVFAGEILIGFGVANIYRDELCKAGIGDGYHGFRISLDKSLYIGSAVEISLFDKVKRRYIAIVPFKLYLKDSCVLMHEELDGKSIHGKKAQKSRLKIRGAKWIMRRILKPIKRTLHIFKKPAVEVPAPGTLLKLANISHITTRKSCDSHELKKIELVSFKSHDNSRHKVTVIIPSFNQCRLTYECLVSLILSCNKACIECIVVDDASTDDTFILGQYVKNLKLIRNTKNLGFLHSCNKAASIAKGDYIVFLNNDTEVHYRWIDSLLDVFDKFSNVGSVGAKLVYPDGRLQDAGGIVWNSGQPWNTGHGQDPDDPQFNYVREVDYLTGAALMVTREAWEDVKGFSEQYAPAYYEDTDLAFKLRKAGYRTLYCPQSVVTHYEGCTNGTDLNSGLKKYQNTNAIRFKELWNDEFRKLGVEGENIRAQKDRNRGLRVLMVDNSFPRLGQDAGSYAAIQELKLLMALDCKVTFLPNNLLHMGIHVEYLEKLGVECVYAPFHRTVEKYLELHSREFDLVYVTRYLVAEKIIPMVRRYSKAPIIFNNADLHFLREFRSAVKEKKTDLAAVYKTREREIGVMQKADVVLSYSDIELEIIASHLLCQEKLFQCPWVINTESQGMEFSERKDIGFMGGFAHPPNRLAVDWFLENVMPVLHRRNPELRFHIWGSHIPKDNDWASTPGVVLEGYAETLNDVFEGIVAFVAPLQAGAGIKGKVLDSLAYGVPTILSPIAAEATGLLHGSSTLIASSSAEWVEYIEHLLVDDQLWRKLRNNSKRIREERYSKVSGIKKMKNVLDYLALDTSVVHEQVLRK